MKQQIRTETIIEPGGVIRVCEPNLPVGEKAEVIILFEPSIPRRRPLVEMIGAGKGSFLTPEEADAFLRKERDARES